MKAVDDYASRDIWFRTAQYLVRMGKYFEGLCTALTKTVMDMIKEDQGLPQEHCLGSEGHNLWLAIRDRELAHLQTQRPEGPYKIFWFPLDHEGLLKRREIALALMEGGHVPKEAIPVVVRNPELPPPDHYIVYRTDRPTEVRSWSKVLAGARASAENLAQNQGVTAFTVAEVRNVGTVKAVVKPKEVAWEEKE